MALVCVVAMMLNTSFAYTLTLQHGDKSIVTTRSVGSEVMVQIKDPNYKTWQIIKGDVEIRDNKFIMPEEDVELKAVGGYRIIFDANGGASAPEEMLKLPGEALVLPNMDQYPREYYEFLGWSTIEAAKEPEYIAGENFYLNQETILYAVWKNIITDLEVGTYIQHIPTADEALIEKSYTGHTEDQTLPIDKNEATRMKYKVYRNNDGQLDIISAESVGSIYLNGNTGYICSVFALNRLCNKYINEYADIAVSIGSTRDYHKLFNGTRSNDKTRSIGRIDTWKGTGYPLTFAKTNGITDKYPYADTHYKNTMPLDGDGKLIECLRQSSGTTVWLATRDLANTSTTVSNFYCSYVTSAGNTGDQILYKAYKDTSKASESTSKSYGVRPVVSLKGGLIIVGGSGTADDPYVVDWDRTVYKIKYNVNGGNVAPSTQAKTPDKDLTLTSTVPTRLGYTFTEWNTSNDGTGTPYSAGDTFIEDKDITLYAQWEPEPLPAFRYSGNCTLVDDGDSNWRIKFLSSGSLVFYQTSESLDVFAVGGGGGGQRDGGGGGGGGYTKTVKDVDIATSTTYKIVIGEGGTDCDGGASSMAQGSTTIITANGGKVANKSYGTNPGKGGNGGSGGGGAGFGTNDDNPDPEYPGDGGSNGGNGENGNSRGTYLGGTGQGTTTREFGESSGTLYAGGGGGAVIYGTYGSQYIGKGGSGGGANGWKSAAANTGGGGGGREGKGGSGIVIVRNSRNTHTVSYDANGGTGAPASQSKIQGISIKLSTTEPTREKHFFLGWSTDSSATTATYLPGATFKENGNITLYAVWQPYAVSFDYTGTYEMVHEGESNGVMNWHVNFLTSGILTFLEDVDPVDVFLLGGGGAGRKSNGTAAGGGGYYTTANDISVTKDTEYSIVIGDPGDTEGESGYNSSALGHSANGGGSATAGDKVGQTCVVKHPGGGAVIRYTSSTNASGWSYLGSSQEEVDLSYPIWYKAVTVSGVTSNCYVGYPSNYYYVDIVSKGSYIYGGKAGTGASATNVFGDGDKVSGTGGTKASRRGQGGGTSTIKGGNGLVVMRNTR